MFEKAYQSLAPEEQARVDSVLAALASEAKLAHFCVNLKLEHFLPVELMATVLRRLAAMQGAAPGSINFSRILEGMWLAGGKVRGKAARRVGRAAGLAEFVRWLRQDPGVRRIYRTDRALETIIEDALRRDDPVAFRELLQRVPHVNMTAHAAWVTWNAGEPGGDPFGWRQTVSPDEVRCHLGLLCRAQGEPLILLVYDVPAGWSLIRPTICDADINWPFEPPPLDFDGHGLTKPLPEASWPSDIRALPAGSRPRRQPEALHEKLPLLHLKLSARNATRLVP